MLVIVHLPLKFRLLRGGVPPEEFPSAWILSCSMRNFTLIEIRRFTLKTQFHAKCAILHKMCGFTRNARIRVKCFTPNTQFYAKLSIRLSP